MFAVMWVFWGCFGLLLRAEGVSSVVVFVDGGAGGAFAADVLFPVKIEASRECARGGCRKRLACSGEETTGDACDCCSGPWRAPEREGHRAT